MALRTFTAEDGVIVGDLLHYGLDNISAAQRLIELNARYFDSAGYLAHLGFELALKGWHLHSLGKFVGTHCLKDLWDGLAESIDDVVLSPAQLSTLKMLDTYAELRYPNRNAPVEIGSDDWARIADLQSALFSQMPPEIHDLLAKLSGVAKGGRALMEKPVKTR